MVAVQHKTVHIRHFTIEAHARLDAGHILHTTHIFSLCDHDRSRSFTHGTGFYMEFYFLNFRQLSAKQGRQGLTLVFSQFFTMSIFLYDQTVNDITVHTGETALFQFLFQHIDHRDIQLSVHQQDIIALVLGCINISVLLICIVCIQIDQIAVLVSLVILDQSLIFLKSIILAVRILEQSEFIGFFIEVFLRQHTVIDEDLQVIPFGFELLTVVLEDRLQTVGYLLGDISRDLLHI